MCGFAGEFCFEGSANLAWVNAMARVLSHRGPDQVGQFLSHDQHCAIGFQRLSILDPEGSSQPMVCPEKKLALAFNGEIYNFQALRNELSRQWTFQSQGDTETLLALYEQKGPEMVQQLEGMFAFALYDEKNRKLLLARDRIGQKPLWVAKLPDRIIFASEIKALQQHPKVKKDISPLFIMDYVTLGYSLSNQSAYRDIVSLPPASISVETPEGGNTEIYWEPPLRSCEYGSGSSADTPGQKEESQQAILRQLRYSVDTHRVADVPVGVLLSGGIDSAVVTALLCELADSPQAVRTFTAGFSDAPQYDERAAAKQVADFLGTQHTEIVIDPPDPCTILDTIVDQYDQPFADSSAIPTFLVCQAARDHVKVALVGDGGDEVFAGYDRYRAMLLGQTLSLPAYLAVQVSARIARILIKPFTGSSERSQLSRFLRFAAGLAHPPAIQYLQYRQLFSSAELPRLFTRDFLDSHAIDVDETARQFCDLYAEGDFEAEAANAQRHDIQSYLPGDLLRKSDTASMACSLELRAPFLDHKLVEMGLQASMDQKIQGKRGKQILKQLFSEKLPKQVFERPKRGFAVPLAQWLRGPMREQMVETLRNSSLKEKGILQEEALVGLMNDHIAQKADHSHRLWALMVLARWLSRG